MTDKYELTTLLDIFENVPTNKVNQCMNEIAVLMIQCKACDKSMKDLAYTTTGDTYNIECRWPETITWVDDGKGEVIVDVSINDLHVATLKTNA
jgi:hypothetical protein